MMPSVPAHVYYRWRFLNQLIDLQLAAGLKPWPQAEDACAAIWEEWAL